MKILLKGYYGFGNLGDDILLKVSYSLIKNKYPQSEISVFSNHSINLNGFKKRRSYNEYIYALIGEEVPLIDWTYSGFFDILIDGGGGVYFDTRKGPVYYYPINFILKLMGVNLVIQFDNLFRALLHKPKRIKFECRYGIGIGVGPFHPTAKGYYRKLADLGSYQKLSVRDSFSTKLLNQLNFSGELHQGTDLSFLVDLWRGKEILGTVKKESNRIGIVLKGGSKETHNHYKKIAFDLEKLKMEVEFFAFDELFDQDYIINMLPEYKVNTWRPNECLLREYINEFWKCTICVTDRAHGALIGAIGGVIPLVVKSSQKSDQIVDILQLEYITDISGYKKLYHLDDILMVHKDQKNIATQLNLIVQERKLSSVNQLEPFL